MTVRGGETNKRVRVERYTTTRDASGEEIESWSTWKVRWASIDPLSGTKRLLAQQVQPNVSYEVGMRYLDGITPKDRISYRGLILEIISIIDSIEGHRSMTLMCREWVKDA